MLKVSSILIGVSDLKKARPFYEQVMGMTFDEFRPPFGWAKMHIGGRKQVSFQTTEVLEDFLKKAETAGAKIVKEPEARPWGWKEAIIADMDGNEFLIEQEM